MDKNPAAERIWSGDNFKPEWAKFPNSVCVDCKHAQPLVVNEKVIISAADGGTCEKYPAEQGGKPLDYLEGAAQCPYKAIE